MKKYKSYFVGVLVGSFFGAAIGQPIVARIREALPHVYISTTDWQAQAASIREMWLQDRRDWRDGKPFEVHYGRHHERW